MDASVSSQVKSSLILYWPSKLLQFEFDAYILVSLPVVPQKYMYTWLMSTPPFEPLPHALLLQTSC